VIVDKLVINVTVKESEDIKFNCTLGVGDDVTWKHGDGSDINYSNRIRKMNSILIISNASSNDAGSYVCSKLTPQGKVSSSYQVNLRVNGKQNLSILILLMGFENTLDLMPYFLSMHVF
jgi:hypothetical protein